MSHKTGSFDVKTNDTGDYFELTSGSTGTVESAGQLTDNTGNPLVTFDSGTTSLTNSGVISATGDRALYAKSLNSGSKVTITNTSGAKILDATTADNNDTFKVKNDFAGGSVTINNSGYIVAGALNGSNQVTLGAGTTTTGQALDLDDVASSLVTINNYAGGVIAAADSDAVRPGADAVINNYGKIFSQNASSTSSGNDAIDTQDHIAGSLTVTNYQGGSIVGARHGITGEFGITVDNAGTISGNLGSGINLDDAPGEDSITAQTATNTLITNEVTGVISGNGGTNGDGTAQDGDGVDVDYTVTLKNYGHINATGMAVGTGDASGAIQEAVTVGGGEIDNYAGGVIQSVQRAITVDDSNDGNAYTPTVIYNEGDIHGVDSAIDGNIGAISITDTFADTLTNKGTIEGSIALGAGDDTINLYTGSSISGLLDAGAGNDTLNLMGTGVGTVGATANIETVNLESGDWTLSSEGFNTVAFGSGAETLRLAASTTADGSYTGTISGFAAGDTLDLIGFNGATTTTHLDRATDVLSVQDGAGHATTIQLAGDFTGEAFAAAASSDGAGLTLETDTAPCYCPGTRILTDKGEVAVEDLAIGDVVVTASGAHRPVRWIGHRHLDLARHSRPDEVYPVRIRAGAFADNVPHRDLWVSPRHGIFADGNLMPAISLVNGMSVEQVTVAKVSYYHVELESHDILLAEGLTADSYLDCGNRAGFHNGADFLELHPTFEPKHWTEQCAPFFNEGPEVDAVKAMLAARLPSRAPATVVSAQTVANAA